VHIRVDDESYPDAPVGLVESAVRHALRAEGREDVEISVAFLPDEEMQRLNLQFLGKDRTTDVLSFSLAGGDGDGTTVGDIYVGWDEAARQAREHGVAFYEELARLAIHGTLHVLGHDHPEDAGRTESPMFRLQERLLAELLGESARD